MQRNNHRSAWSAAGIAALSLLFGAILGVAGAKLFFLLRCIGRSMSLQKILSLSGEELSFTGGCIGFTAGICLAGKLCRRDIGRLLDAWTIPACLLVAAGRVVEYYTAGFGVGDYLDGVPNLFPLTVQDYYGDTCLAVFTLEALTAVCVAVWAWICIRKGKTKLLFGRAVVLLCSAQLFWEMLRNSWIQMYAFCVHLEQVLCALVLLVLIAAWCMKAGKAGPVIVTVLLIGLNALMQYVQDKPYYFSAVLPKGIPVIIIVRVFFALTAAGIAAAGLTAAKRVSQAS